MNKKLQQRIVGSVAVIALLILVLPHLFSSNVPTVPPRNNDSSNATNTFNNNQSDSFSDFETSVISVEPIPTIDQGNSFQNITDNASQTTPPTNTPVSENMWSDVTEQPTRTPSTPNSDNTNNAENNIIANNTDPQLSVAEQLLADAQTKTPINNNDNVNTAAPLKLPKIELIGSTVQPNSNKGSNTNNTAKTQVATQQKFTWYIQVGSYSSKKNADKVASEYQNKGYPSAVVVVSGQYKVQIGPLKSQANARNVQTELKRYGINSFIIEIK